MSAIVSSHRVFDGANHGAPAMYSGASGCSSMQMGPEGLLIKCGFGYSDVSRCIYAPGSSTPASPSGSSPRLRPHRAPVHPELTSHGVHADALCAGCSHSVHFLVGQACSRSFLWFRRRADQRVVGLAVGLCIRANPLIPRGNQPLDPRSPVPTTLHCFHNTEAHQVTWWASSIVPGYQAPPSTVTGSLDWLHERLARGCTR